jgi:hypothetical protein
LLALALVACDSRATTRQEEAALAAAKRWFALTDGGDHGGAWDLGSPEFKVAIRRDVWDAAQATLYR